MAEPKKSKRKKKKRAPRKRTERVFAPEAMAISRPMAAAGGIAATVLGVGVYGQWIRDYATKTTPLEHAQWIVVAGALGLAAVLWFGDKTSHPVRVGDGGIAIDKGNDLTRVAWCDMDRLFIESGNLIVIGEGIKLQIPIRAQARAVAWAIKECAERMPEALDVRPGESDSLPGPADDDGELVEIADVQVAGAECATSGTLISFERDARLCKNCGEIYHRKHVPAECETCGARLGERAVAA